MKNLHNIPFPPNSRELRPQGDELKKSLKEAVKANEKILLHFIQ